MTTASRESQPAPGSAGILPHHLAPAEEWRKNRGGDITSMWTKFVFVAPATPAGAPSRDTRPSRPLPGRPGRAGCGLPGAPTAFPPFRITKHETRAFMFFTNHESRNTAFTAVRFAVGAQGSHNKKNRRPDCRFRSPVNASLLTSARHCPAPLFLACLLTIAHHCSALCAIVQYGGAVLLPLSQCPRTVSRSRSASRRAPLAAAPVAIRAPSAAANAQ